MPADAALNALGLTEIIMVGAGAAVLIVLLLVLLLAFRPKRRPLSRRQYNADLYRRKMALEQLSFPVIHDIRIAEAQGKVLRIGHIMRLPASVLIILSGPLDAVGQVKASPSSGHWRYIAAGGEIGTIVNPVVQMHSLIQAFRSRFPLVRIRLLTVFPNTAEIAAGAKSVCLSGELVKVIRDMANEDGTVSQAVENAWEPLSRALAQASAAVAANKRGSGTGTGGRPAVS